MNQELNAIHLNCGTIFEKLQNFAEYLKPSIERYNRYMYQTEKLTWRYAWKGACFISNKQLYRPTMWKQLCIGTLDTENLTVIWENYLPVCFSIKLYVLGTPYYCLPKKILKSTHNMQFDWEIRKFILWLLLLELYCINLQFNIRLLNQCVYKVVSTVRA